MLGMDSFMMNNKIIPHQLRVRIPVRVVAMLTCDCYCIGLQKYENLRSFYGESTEIDKGSMGLCKAVMAVVEVATMRILKNEGLL